MDPFHAGGTAWRTASVELCLDLTTILARNAYELIETSDDVFDFVTDADQHTGTRTRMIDAANERLANRWLNLDRVRRSAPDEIFMHSEEATRPWRGTADEKPWLLQVDEFDGTTIATGSANNWSVSALAFVWSHRRHKYSLAGGAIAGHDGHVVTYVNTTTRIGGVASTMSGDVWFRRYDLFSEREPDSLEPVALGPATYVDGISSGTADMLAINAAAGDRGSALVDTYTALLTGTRYRTLCAGTPIVYGAIRGRIGMIIDPVSATLHDANHLFPLACLGWGVYDLESMKSIDVLKLAEENCEPGGVRRPIPPCVTVRSPEALNLYQQLVFALPRGDRFSTAEGGTPL